MENNNEHVDYLNLEALMKEAKRKERQKKIKQKVKKVKNWVGEHKIEILTLSPIAVKVVTGTVKTANKRFTLNKEKELKDLYCYDRSLGHYWELKRKLKNSEWIKINKRRDNGESLADILNEMNVLKR